MQSQLDCIIHQLWKHVLLDLGVSEDGWVGVDFNQIGIQVFVEQEVKAEQLEASEFLLELVLD